MKDLDLKIWRKYYDKSHALAKKIKNKALRDFEILNLNDELQANTDEVRSYLDSCGVYSPKYLLK